MIRFYPYISSCYFVLQDPVKFWFIFLIGVVITFQCVTTDIFIFRTIPPNPPPLTPAHTTPMGNFTRVTYNWITLNTAGSTKPQLHDDVTVLP
ncbi:hypothetical protein FSP39_008903 [Pinctada imbricata]|uniref:Uncharacterized protein n=1 Tax=Pinctada imbricata TaxID=66713 RepID=A0AA88XQP0_PINIB|nr:hypothetical protein FSP39_008903 [Pinctada imbricata]